MAKFKKIPLIELLLSRDLVGSRAEGIALIMAGKVVVGDQRATKPGTAYEIDISIRIKDQQRFVSRAGEKLHGAIEDLGLGEQFVGAVVLDVGASTGGFTDCVLQLGATHVIALDVGTNQLAWKLRSVERVTSLEKTDIRDFDRSQFAPIDWIVADVSFNSLARLAESIWQASTPKLTKYLLLVKPQFELAANEVDFGGVVSEPGLRDKAVESVVASFIPYSVQVREVIEARVKGRKGNQEIFVYLTP